MAEKLENALTKPSFDALTIQIFVPPGGNPSAIAESILASAVSQVPGQPTAGWQILPVHPMAPGAFDLLPPPGSNISVQDGFNLKYALEKDARIIFADALFETNLDNIPEGADFEEQPTELEGVPVNWRDQLIAAELDPLWSIKLIEADRAWAQSKGTGIIVGHPDSGYITHPELDDLRILHDLERDIYDGDVSSENPEDRGGNHGLSTASVILSGEAKLTPEEFVVGVAPEAKIVPMRITKKGPPILFTRSGPRRVRDAVYLAIENGCEIISMSLGGLGDKSLHEAIKTAVRHNILVLCAAGNVVRLVVWPARYPETIAVAACTVERRPWFHSSRGPTVDISAPGHNVWRAWIDAGGLPGARPSSGTSYAVATAAGAAALWLGFHGRKTLINRYLDVPLQEVFRKLLIDSADPPPEGHNGQFGKGTINAFKLLQAPLPSPDEVLAFMVTGPLASAEELSTLDPFGKISATFDTIPEEDVRTKLMEMMGSSAENLPDQLSGFEDEMVFQIVTQPELRQAFTPAVQQSIGIEDDGFILDGPLAGEMADEAKSSLREIFAASPLSNDLLAEVSD